MISLDEAQHYVRQTLTPLPPLELSLDDALGCGVVEELTARESVPGFLNTAMDRYALRSVDVSTGSAQLRVTGSVMAGDVPAKRLMGGETMRVMTGAPVPDGADCVCMIEEVTVAPLEQSVTINHTIGIGENVRHPGEDVAIGQILVAPRNELRPTELGVLASQGFTSVRVHLRPRVGVLSTGNELADSTGPLKSGKIRDINRPMLQALLSQSGFTPVDLGIIRDDQSALAGIFQKAVTECDAVISTGGVSVGDVDHVKTVITDLCGERARWMQVAIKPGKPITFGIAGARGTPVFGLPGNPVSTLARRLRTVRASFAAPARWTEDVGAPNVQLGVGLPIAETARRQAPSRARSGQNSRGRSRAHRECQTPRISSGECDRRRECHCHDSRRLPLYHWRDRANDHVEHRWVYRDSGVVRSVSARLVVDDRLGRPLRRDGRRSVKAEAGPLSYQRSRVCSYSVRPHAGVDKVSGELGCRILSDRRMSVRDIVRNGAWARDDDLPLSQSLRAKRLDAVSCASGTEQTKCRIGV